MFSTRAITVAVAVFAVLWLMLDSGLVTVEPAPPGTSLSLAMLATVFGAGAFVMQNGGHVQRVPMLAGMAMATGAYALVHAFVP
jgi:hypothetical protein